MNSTAKHGLDLFLAWVSSRWTRWLPLLQPRAMGSSTELTVLETYLGIKHFFGIALQFTKCLTLPRELSLLGVGSIQLRHVVRESNHRVAKLYPGHVSHTTATTKLTLANHAKTFFFLYSYAWATSSDYPSDIGRAPLSLPAVPSSDSLGSLHEDAVKEIVLPERCRFIDSRTLIDADV